MRADAHYVDQLDAPPQPRQRVRHEPAPAASEPSLAYAAHRDLGAALHAIESCAALLDVPSPLARRAASQVIAAECRRAHRQLIAIQVLANELPIRRTAMRPLDLLNRVRDAFLAEQQLLGQEATVHIDASPQLSMHADIELLFTALGNALAALTTWAGARPRDIVLTAAPSTTAGRCTLEVTDRGLFLTDPLIRAAFAGGSALPNADGIALLLGASRAIAAGHGGSLDVINAESTALRFELPVDPAGVTRQA
jgi:light-regulated signal transduction histidine kinase (bacteriophytochrome)